MSWWYDANGHSNDTASHGGSWYVSYMRLPPLHNSVGRYAEFGVNATSSPNLDTTPPLSASLCLLFKMKTPDSLVGGRMLPSLRKSELSALKGFSVCEYHSSPSLFLSWAPLAFPSAKHFLLWQVVLGMGMLIQALIEQSYSCFYGNNPRMTCPCLEWQERTWTPTRPEGDAEWPSIVQIVISCFVAAVCVGVAATQLTAGILSALQPAGLKRTHVCLCRCGAYTSQNIHLSGCVSGRELQQLIKCVSEEGQKCTGVFSLR